MDPPPTHQKNKQSISDLGKIQVTYYMCNWDPWRMEEIWDKKIWRNSDLKFPRFDENYIPMDPQSKIKPKHKKHEENYPKACHNRISQDQR